jgi:hypothetical protein
MRTREKARIWRRFMKGESVVKIAFSPHTGIDTNHPLVWQVEAIIREGATGKFDKGSK